MENQLAVSYEEVSFVDQVVGVRACTGDATDIMPDENYNIQIFILNVC